MTRHDIVGLGRIGGFLGGAAVVASLVFVGLQLRQNTQAMRAAASQAHAANLQQIVSYIVTDNDAARVWRVGVSNQECLTDDERVRFVSLISGFFRFFEAARLQSRHGQLDPQHWHYVEHQMRDLVRQPGVQMYWRMRKHWHSHEFCNWVDALPAEKLDHEFYDQPA